MIPSVPTEYSFTRHLIKLMQQSNYKVINIDKSQVCISMSERDTFHSHVTKKEHKINFIFDYSLF